jgi:RimJ/RimL family protein N-acetyltransferase
MAFGPEINAAYTDGARITLREPDMPDLDTLFEHTDEEALTYLSDLEGEYQALFHPTPDMYLSEVRRFRRTMHWGIYGALPGEARGRLLGLSSLLPADAAFDVLLLAPGSRGKGFGTRTSRLVMAAHFMRSPHNAFIDTFIDPDNKPSLRMAAKVGMAELPWVGGHSLSYHFQRSRPDVLEQASYETFVRSLGEQSLATAMMALPSPER